MSRSLPPLTGILLALVLPACGPPQLPAGSPVILVVVDTLRADHLGAYGYERATSPEIDRWATRGALFERAFATAPWTLPSTASLLTGLQPHRHGAGRFTEARAGRKRRVNVGLDESVPTLATLLAEQGYTTGAFVTNSFLRPPFGLDRGFDSYDAQGHKGSSQRPAAPMVDAALAWLDERAGEPFFLFLHLMDPHLPYDPPLPARGRFADEGEGRLRAPIAGMRGIRYMRPPLRPPEQDYVAALYDEEISYTDLHVGRFLDGLEERGLMERALVIFASDHGEELWEHGGFEHGHVFYQELLHVPLVFWAPPVRPARIDAPVSQVDVLPTVLDALGLPLPEEQDGVSLWPALTGAPPPRNREIVAHNSLRGSERQVLVAWPWKLIAFIGNDPPRLFDLESDPGEQTNLAEQQPERTAEMLSRLRRQLPAVTTSARGRAVQLDEETRMELEALGYAEEGDGS